MSTLLPPRQYQRKISLTPLVDVIFLLLIFFMLTSQIAPFSLISFSKAKIENTPEQIELPQGGTPALAGLGALITVYNGGISVNGVKSAHAEIDTTMINLRESGTTSAIISPRSSATVQDLITVLEAVKRANFATVSIRKSK